MNIGSLDKRVKLLKYTEITPDEGFGAKLGWATAATVWANVHPPHFAQSVAAGSGDAVVITQGITIRDRSDVQKGWRVELAGETYNVLHVDRSKSGQLTMTCKQMEVDT